MTLSNQQQPGWFFPLIPNISQIQNSGGGLPQRQVINFTVGVTATDDPVNGRTNVAIVGGSYVGVITSPGTYAVSPGEELYLDLFTIGGNVILTTAGIGVEGGFSVTLVDPTNSGVGGFTCTLHPITPGNHIDATYPPSGPSSPGTLTTSAVLTAIGEGGSYRSPDGTNLWLRP